MTLDEALRTLPVGTRLRCVSDHDKSVEIVWLYRGSHPRDIRAGRGLVGRHWKDYNFGGDWEVVTE